MGDQATGKTSIIKRSITNSFSDVHKPTIGVDFHFRKFEMGGSSVALQLWDIAGAFFAPKRPSARPRILCTAPLTPAPPPPPTLRSLHAAGQDRFGTLYRIYYRDAFGALLVFDLSRPDSFHNVLRVRFTAHRFSPPATHHAFPLNH